VKFQSMIHNLPSPSEKIVAQEVAKEIVRFHAISI